MLWPADWLPASAPGRRCRRHAHGRRSYRQREAGTRRLLPKSAGARGARRLGATHSARRRPITLLANAHSPAARLSGHDEDADGWRARGHGDARAAAAIRAHFATAAITQARLRASAARSRDIAECRCLQAAASIQRRGRRLLSCLAYASCRRHAVVTPTLAAAAPSAARYTSPTAPMVKDLRRESPRQDMRAAPPAALPLRRGGHTARPPRPMPQELAADIDAQPPLVTLLPIACIRPGYERRLVIAADGQAAAPPMSRPHGLRRRRRYRAAGLRLIDDGRATAVI